MLPRPLLIREALAREGAPAGEERAVSGQMVDPVHRAQRRAGEIGSVTVSIVLVSCAQHPKSNLSTS